MSVGLPVVKLLVVQVLNHSRDLIASPAKWTKFSMARTKHNCGISLFLPEAEKFCLAGAVIRSASDVRDELRLETDTADLRALQYQVHVTVMLRARHEIEKTIFPQMPMSYNDNPRTTHADVISVINRTIDRINTEGLSKEYYL